MKNKIVHIITGLGGGGAEKMLYTLLANDNNNIHSVISLSDDDVYSKLIEDIGIKVHILPINKFTIFYNFFRLLSMLWVFKPTIIQTWMYHPNIFTPILKLIFYKTKFLWTIHHGKISTEHSNYFTLFILFINKILSYLIPDNIVYCSNVSRHENEVYGFCKNKSIVIVNSVDSKIFVKQKNYDVHLDTYNFLSVARFDPYKNHSLLFKSFKILASKYHNVELHLYGSNVDQTNKVLLDLIDYYGLSKNVYLKGYTRFPETIYHNYFCTLLSSDFESFGNVLLESYFSNVNCISTDVGEARSILNGVGIIVPVDDSLLFARAMENMINSYERSPNEFAKSVNNKKNQLIANYSIQRYIQNYNDLWSSFCFDLK